MNFEKHPYGAFGRFERASRDLGFEYGISKCDRKQCEVSNSVVKMIREDHEG